MNNAIHLKWQRVDPTRMKLPRNVGKDWFGLCVDMISPFENARITEWLKSLQEEQCHATLLLRAVMWRTFDEYVISSPHRTIFFERKEHAAKFITMLRCLPRRERHFILPSRTVKPLHQAWHWIRKTNKDQTWLIPLVEDRTLVSMPASQEADVAMVLARMTRS